MNSSIPNFNRGPLTLLFAAILALAAVSYVESAQPPTQQKIDAIFSPLANANSPGLAVLILKDGKKIFARGYGLSDLRTHTKIDEHTNFRLASCTKQFTAMAIMLLVHDKKLRYDESLSEIFPQFPAYGKHITIRNLLNHTAGLPDYESLMEEAQRNKPPRWSAQEQIQDQEVLTLLEQTRIGLFPPGTQWAYSNSGYVILGLVVAKVSGESFPEFLRHRIFAPLKMSHTAAYVKGKNDISNRAFGHTRAGDQWRETDQSDTSATLGDGGIYSSLEDLAKWDEALRTQQLLSAEDMQPALTPAKLSGDAAPRWPANSDRPAGSDAIYGFGWFLDPYRGHARMWHYGETIGFHSYIARFPSEQLTIVILTNRTDISPEIQALHVADLFLVDSPA